MRSLLTRLAVLGAFAVSLSACGNGNGSSLPFAGPPNNSGGVSGTFQSGGNGTALLRFIQGSPDSGTPPNGTVDVCVDNLPWNLVNPSVNYGSQVPTGLYSVPGGIAHTISVYPGQLGANAGVECPTAPGPYLGVNTIKITTLNPAIGQRLTIVLGGTKASGLGLYVFSEPSFAITPSGFEAISHNAAPVFSTGKPNGVGFGICTTTVTPCTVPTNLTGAQGVAVGKVSSPPLAVVNGSPVQSGMNGIPAGFYDGTGVPAGVVVPITSVPAPNAIAGQPYIIQLYAIDGPAGGLNLIALIEQTLGFSF